VTSAGIIGNPETWFFTNPHPPLKEGDEVNVILDTGERRPATVLHYIFTSPRCGDMYHVRLDNGADVTFALDSLEPRDG
jgi:hypothetical protein